MAKKRLFIGLGFSEKISKELEPWVKKIKKTADHKELSLKWTPPGNYHVTLVFLGDTDESEIPMIQEKMQSVAQAHTEFSLKVRGIGGFPQISQARVLYIGVQRSQNLLDLQSDLEKEFKNPEEYEREYSPHMTIARLRNPKSCRDLLSPFEHLDLGKQHVREIILFQSVLAGAFPVYERLFEVSLSKPEISLE